MSTSSNNEFPKLLCSDCNANVIYAYVDEEQVFA